MTQGKHASTLEIEGPRRVRRSREEGRALVEQWRSSGQTPARFCHGQGIATQRLRYWRQQVDEDEAQTVPRAADFLALEASLVAEEDARQHSDAATMVEIRATDAVLVRVPVAAGRAVFVQTLRGVLEALGS